MELNYELHTPSVLYSSKIIHVKRTSMYYFLRAETNFTKIKVKNKKSNQSKKLEHWPQPTFSPQKRKTKKLTKQKNEIFTQARSFQIIFITHITVR